MNKQQLSELVQYIHIKQPSTKEENDRLNQFICIASGIKYQSLLRITADFSLLNKEYLQAYSVDSESKETQEALEKRNRFYMRMVRMFEEKVGIDLTKSEEMTVEEIWIALQKKHSRSVIIKRVFFEEIHECLTFFLEHDELKDELMNEFRSFGLKPRSVVALANALTIDDKEECSQAYKAAYLVLEEQLQRHFEEVSVMEAGSCKMRLDSIVENLIQLNQFRDVEDDFNLHQLYYISEVMLIKACMSKVLKRVPV
ncbi:hypothetical protein IX95_07140 [Vibrio sp. B183]|uniref:hypothetical protein n=1 Tax=Vibrio sp. B183 TaxID=1526762 RepID=UPI00050583A1|nr:hypothetical protein [Vibrio sp. B183]KFI12721.1 hypothetical protein IX95_07140 [Vibrio sp. B183]